MTELKQDIPVEEAQRLILASVRALGAGDVALADAAGRFLADPVTALRASPPFTNSAMDGFAIIHSGSMLPSRFTVVGLARAGGAWRGTMGKRSSGTVRRRRRETRLECSLSARCTRSAGASHMSFRR